MNVNDKIKQILIDKSLSPSVFADEIGVQRSSISHILSGRNRPSFDIIQKVIRRYPDLGYDWIMEEEEPEEKPYDKKPTRAGLRSETKSVQPRDVSPGGYTQRVRPTTTLASVQVMSPGTVASSATVAPPIPTILPEKTVERILIFYTDGTFKEYMPAN